MVWNAEEAMLHAKRLWQEFGKLLARVAVRVFQYSSSLHLFSSLNEPGAVYAEKFAKGREFTVLVLGRLCLAVDGC